MVSGDVGCCSQGHTVSEWSVVMSVAVARGIRLGENILKVDTSQFTQSLVQVFDVPLWDATSQRYAV